MKIKTNNDNHNLWCCECKQIIAVTEKYGEINEQVLDDIELKEYHLDCVPLSEDDDYLVDEDVPEDIG